MSIIDFIKNNLLKRVVSTTEKTILSSDGKKKAVYTCELFVSNIDTASRFYESEIIAISHEKSYIKNLKGEFILDYESSLVNIYACSLDMSGQFGTRSGVMYLKNSSVDDLKRKSLKAELYLVECNSHELIWREYYSSAENESVPAEIIEKLNNEERICKIHIGANGKLSMKYDGACIAADAFDYDDAQKYRYRFSASEK